MIQKYVEHLIDNLQDRSDFPIEIDLVLSGGAFNGSYIIGALYYLKEMERQKLITVKRISGSSIGSISGLLYFSDRLDLFVDFYEIMYSDFKNKKNLSKLLQLKDILNDKIPEDICERIKEKFYLCYTNVKSYRKVIKRHFKNKEDLFDNIIRSCYVPFLIDYKPCYKNKYIDGMLPYMFPKTIGRKLLYLNVFTHDKIVHVIDIRNETTNLHRIYGGIIDIHFFFTKKSNTVMCSYIDNWFWYEYLVFYICYLLEFIIMLVMYYTNKILNNKILKKISKKIIDKIITKLFN